VTQTTATNLKRDNPADQPTNDGVATLCKLVGVSKAFGSQRVLDEIDLAFERGKTTVVLGPSGTGKSVLLKHLVGLLKPDQGEIWFENLRIDQLSEHQLTKTRKQIGFLFQMGALFDSHTVRDNVCFPLMDDKNVSRSQRLDRCEHVLRLVGLPETINKMPNELSGGQRKRVALARAIVLEPKLILYDEPTTGLDPITADLINELIVTLAENLGITSIAVTHDFTSAKKIADRMVMLDQGRIIADEPRDTFLQSDDTVVQRFIKGQADKEDLQCIHASFSNLNTK
jgi:phospholipid/cholesterol/gamma-HCH transport system ATP-binding protein